MKVSDRRRELLLMLQQIGALKDALHALLGEKKALPTEETPPPIPIPNVDRRQYLTGVKLHGEFVVFLVRTSGSMLDDTIDAAAARLEDSDEKKREAPKWRRTVAALEWMLASESVALDMLGFTLERDVAPGEAIYVDMHGRLHAHQCAPPSRHTPCIFEYVYFARPDSIIDNISVHKARMRMGEKLAEKIQRLRPDHDIDVVIPIPDTSRTSALQLALALGVKYREGFVKNRYIGRTFIMPNEQQRRDSVRAKLNPIRVEFAGKRVLIVDDSIVRGNTSRQIVKIARQMGATKVYLASYSPALLFPCPYGIDMSTKREFIARDKTAEQVAHELGADHLVYQSREDMLDAVRGQGSDPEGDEERQPGHPADVADDVAGDGVDARTEDVADDEQQEELGPHHPLELGVTGLRLTLGRAQVRHAAGIPPGG